MKARNVCQQNFHHKKCKH